MEKRKLAISVQEAADLLGVGKDTVYQMARQEDFPAFKCRNRTLVSVKGLEQWVLEQAKKGIAE